MRPVALPLAGLLAVLVTACRSSEPPAPSATPSTPSTPSRTSIDAKWVPLRAPDVASFLELPASVLTAAGATGLVNPPYPGQIVKLNVRAGEPVRRGQAVASTRSRSGRWSMRSL